jgi:hypothetical protein
VVFGKVASFDTSQSADMEFMDDTRCARKAFATSFDTSEDLSRQPKQRQVGSRVNGGVETLKHPYSHFD